MTDFALGLGRRPQSCLHERRETLAWSITELERCLDCGVVASRASLDSMSEATAKRLAARDEARADRDEREARARAQAAWLSENPLITSADVEVLARMEAEERARVRSADTVYRSEATAIMEYEARLIEWQRTLPRELRRALGGYLGRATACPHDQGVLFRQAGETENLGNGRLRLLVDVRCELCKRTLATRVLMEAVASDIGGPCPCGRELPKECATCAQRRARQDEQVLERRIRLFD